MKNKISDSLKEIFYCLVADEYEVENTIKELGYLSMEEQERVGKEFRKIIDQRLWSQNFYLGLTGFEFDSDEGFYAYLEEVWQYIFNNGPKPDIERYWY